MLPEPVHKLGAVVKHLQHGGPEGRIEANANYGADHFYTVQYVSTQGSSTMGAAAPGVVQLVTIIPRAEPPVLLQQCNAMQCNAMQCNAMQCNAMHCTAMQCTALQCNAMQCNAMQCNALHCNAMQCNAMQCTAMQCTALQCSAMHCNAMQYNTAQHNTAQHNTTQHNTTQHSTTQHSTTQHNTTQHNTTQHNTTQHNTTQHNTTQHNTRCASATLGYKRQGLPILHDGLLPKTYGTAPDPTPVATKSLGIVHLTSQSSQPCHVRFVGVVQSSRNWTSAALLSIQT